MKKEIINSIIITAGIVIIASLFFQAQVLKVSARVDSILGVTPGSLHFGIVFPGEKLYKSFTVTLNEINSDSVNYIIRHRPKPIWPEPAACGQHFVNEDAARLYCQNNPSNLNCCYPDLCKQLSEIPDGAPANDTGLLSPHQIEDVALGHLDKAENDLSDTWSIDLAVPCFEGECSQGYSGEPLPMDLEGKDFGCDLWVEVLEAG